MDDIPEIQENRPQSEQKRERIKQNIRLVSPHKGNNKQRKVTRENTTIPLKRENSVSNMKSKVSLSGSLNSTSSGSIHNMNSSLGMSRSLTFTDMERQMISNETRSTPLKPCIRRLSSRKSITAPDLFNIQDFRKLHEENMLKKQFSDMVAYDRLHTTPAVTTKHKKQKEKWEELSHAVDEIVYETDPEIESEVLTARRKSVEDTGLWQLASASAYKYKAMKTLNIEDLSMAVYTKQVAKERMRNRINKKFDLPDDPTERVMVLRNNVKHIERRFRNINSKVTSDNTSATSIHALQRNLNENDLETPKFMLPGQAMSFFRRYARIVLIILKWIELIMDSSEQNKLERELKSFVDIANEVQEEHISKTMNMYGLSFDKNAFKAQKEISLTHDHRKTLTTRSTFRTPEMIKQVMHGLQALRSLSEYPLCTQEKLCQVAWYQTLGAKKAIVRQGHNAESFYFILAGTAFVKKMITDPKTRETRLHTVARLTRGQSFGEIGLIFNTLRTATVESATPMELLVIGKDDFHRIFMNDSQDEEAEHVKFLRQVPVMKNWPVDSLRDEPGTCILHYFKRGQLVSENGKTSEWLYFIKSGSCEVLKKLKNVKARKSGHIQRKPDPMSEIVLPALGGQPDPKIDCGHSRKRHRIYMNTEVFEEMTKYYDSLKRILTNATTVLNDEEGDTTLHLPPLSNNVSHCQTEINNSDGKEKIVSEQSALTCQTGKKCQTSSSHDTLLRIPPVTCDKSDHKTFVSQSKFNIDRFMWLKKYQSHFMLPTQAMLKAETPPDKTVYNSEDDSNARNQSVFVKVELLQAKDVFGINTLTGWGSEEMDDMLKDAPSTCLVSKGAEIVMLSKKVFLMHLTEKVRNHLREVVRPYPQERKMQENFQNMLDWDNYKSTILGDVLSKHVTTEPTIEVH